MVTRKESPTWNEAIKRVSDFLESHGVPQGTGEWSDYEMAKRMALESKELNDISAGILIQAAADYTEV